MEHSERPDWRRRNAAVCCSARIRRRDGTPPGGRFLATRGGTATRRQSRTSVGHRRRLGSRAHPQQHLRDGMAAAFRTPSELSGNRPSGLVRRCRRATEDPDGTGDFRRSIARGSGSVHLGRRCSARAPQIVMLFGTTTALSAHGTICAAGRATLPSWMTSATYAGLSVHLAAVIQSMWPDVTPCRSRARRRGRGPVLHTWQTAYEIVR